MHIRAGPDSATRLLLAASRFFTSAIYDALNGIARTHETLPGAKRCASQCVSRQLLPPLLRTGRWSTCFQTTHLPSMRFTPRFSLEFRIAHTRQHGIAWGEFVANQILAARGQ